MGLIQIFCKNGKTEALYTKCHEVFANLCKHVKFSSIPEADRPRFLEVAGRFYLWGEAFGGGRLDAILLQSPILHIQIMKILAVVARKLLSRKSSVRTQMKVFTDCVQYFL